MNTKALLIFASILGISSVTLAQDENSASRWSHESEVSIVNIDGNTKSESYSGKQKTTYKWDKNVLIASARYLQTKTASVETARAWDAGLRYEREISTLWSAYASQGAESDVYAGYVQRDNSDLGAKYQVFKSDIKDWTAEAGFRHTKIRTTTQENAYTNFGRVFSEYKTQINPSLSFNYWVEYLPNFKESEAYLLNTEASLSVMLSQIFSLKSGYLVKYQNQVAAGAERADKTFTTSLVAKF